MFSINALRGKSATILLVALAACVAQEPEWTRERQSSVTTHKFDGYSSAQIIRAAETVMKLSDPGKVNFEFTPSGFTARRDASLYFIIGGQSGTYRFDTLAKGSTLEVRVFADTSAITASGIFPPGGEMWKLSGVYTLFFARVQHVLDQKSPWITCENAKKTLALPAVDFEPLCISAQDKAPSSAAL